MAQIGCTCTRPVPWVPRARCPSCRYNCRRLCSTMNCDRRKMPKVWCVQSVRVCVCFPWPQTRSRLPLLAAAYRTALGKVNFSVFVAGQTGVFKSALAALCQQHFGAAMDGSSLPANFASTGNALEWLAFYAKDALLVVDDFAPSGRRADAQLQNIAERLFRAAGNHQGRSRMGGDGRLRVQKLPRALILATGEEVPQGQSIRARLVIVEVRAGHVDRTALNECQRTGREGQLAESVGAFVSWIAGQYAEVQERLQNRALEIRSQGCGRTVHARLPSALAELQAGWEIFLQFAQEIGAIGHAQKEELEQRSVKALGQLAAMQAKYHASSDPAMRFVALLQAALGCGRAHVADPRGKPPAEPEEWGWQHRQTGRGWAAQGTRIGWVAGNDLFLDPAVSYQVAQQMASAERMPVSEQTLRQRLRQSGLLASIDVGRGMVQVRRTLEGRPRQVLHLIARDLVRPVQR